MVGSVVGCEVVGIAVGTVVGWTLGSVVGASVGEYSVSVMENTTNDGSTSTVPNTESTRMAVD